MKHTVCLPYPDHTLDLSRVTGLLESGALKETPLWYGVYKKYPPDIEPRSDRPVPPQDPIPEIVYEEDFERVAKARASLKASRKSQEARTTTATRTSKGARDTRASQARQGSREADLAYDTTRLVKNIIGKPE